MKLQNLIIIFIIIIIPIVLIFSLYLKLETKTIMLQTDYDEKLIEAAKEAVEAFEINTTEWNSKYSSLANSKRQDLMSSINVFTTSLADKLGIGGTSKESILNYIPAIVYTMYDGYYIYSPTYIPETITNDNGVQLFYYADSGSEGSQITASATQNIGGTIVSGEPMYVWESGQALTGKYNDKPITFTTKIDNAKKSYEHVLKTFVPYTATYGSYIINYTLDNYIRIYGENQSMEGYIIEDFNNIEIPVNNISGIKYNGYTIEPETLTENIYVRDNMQEDAKKETYPYIYNSNNDKRYYDSTQNKFFIVNNNYIKVYLPEAEVGSALAEYKKVSICPNASNWDYLELYQLLNGNDKAWYYLDSDNKYIKYSAFQPAIDNGKDCSAINYYVQNYNFNNWLNSNSIQLDEVLSQKKQNIINNINNNLNLSISNYNANSKIDYKILEISDEDWEQALSNISMIAFFQGKKIGLKTYNNYVVVTSTENNEYVSEDSLYYLNTEDEYYHRYGCSEISSNTSLEKAYRNTEFKTKSYRYIKNGENFSGYYNTHSMTDAQNKETSTKQCFECIVNRNNFIFNDALYNKVHYTALARERYVQMSKINLIIELNKKITVTFDANGGRCSITSKQVTYNSTYGTLPTPTREGCIFGGWYTAKTGGHEVVDTTRVTNIQNHTLYARWKDAVTFDATGGECSPSSKLVTIGNPYGPLPTPTRTGYNFTGWYTAPDGGDRVTASTIVTNASSHTLYAQWTPISYMITFNANGGSCSTTSKQVTYNSTYGELPTPTRTGHTFSGWYTEESGGTQVTAETTVINASSHTLYAQWNRITYTITYNANGGSEAPDSQEKEHDKNITLSSTEPTRKDHTFKGWSTSENGSVEYKPGETYTANSDATLYAVWEKSTYTVTFDANGGSCSIPSIKVNIGEKYGELPTATRTGYTFNGWYTSATGGTQVTKETTVTKASDHTLYAQWNRITYTITYNANGGSGAPESQTKYDGSNLVLSSKAPTRSGYIFKGWSTSKNGAVEYQSGGTYTKNSNATLYAVWEQVIAVTSVTLNQTEDQWIPYKNNGSVGTLSLTATVSPSNATNKTVTWTSSNTSVATVSNGTVTAIGAGLTTITATAGDKSASVNVYFYNAVFGGGYTYSMRRSVGGKVTGYFKAKSGGAKMVISSQSNNYWYLSNYTNGYYESGDGNYFSGTTSYLSRYFTNYGAW